MATLSDKLKSLGVKIGMRDLPPPRHRAPYAIEQVMPGQLHSTAYGEAYVVENRYPLDMQHGNGSLRLTAFLGPLAEWACEPALAPVELDRLVFLDTETTGLAGGTGTYAFMVGLGRYDSSSFHLLQFFMRGPAEELALLAALARFLVPYQGLVTFNGRGFDVPLLTTRYLVTGFVSHGSDSPLAPLIHLDLLPLARWLWRDRLPSRALSSLETHILGVLRTQEDVPSWMIPELYFDYLRSGDARPLKNVFYHNAMDILSMAALLNHMARLLSDPLGGEVHGLDILAMGRRCEALGRTEAAMRLYEQGIASDLPVDARAQAMQRLSLAHKRFGNLTAAVELWQQAAQSGQAYACVELAKFYEHAQHDYAQAMQWTQTAIDLRCARCLGHSRLAEPFPDPELSDLEHRMRRLQSKRARSQRCTGPVSGS